MVQSTPHNLDVYQPRNPKASAYYKCVENHFEELERAWDDRYALDWLARLVTHIPDRCEQTVRYYGWYSNKSRGMRKKAGTDEVIPAVMPNDMSSKEVRQNWARLIQKIYEVDPLVCPKCQGPMKIISFIEDLDLIEKILRHLGLWDTRNHDPPEPAYSNTIPELIYDDSDSQIPSFDYWN